MKNQLPSLITPDVQSGLALASRLADELQRQLTNAETQVERPGGMNYLLPAPVPKEMIGSILFYAIASANGGWSAKFDN